jgi:hypothetical protein
LGNEFPLLALVGIGAATNTAASFVQQASQNNLSGYYGNSVGSNAIRVGSDALLGGTSVWVGQAAPTR